jgi:hypothetical protein
MRIFMVVVYIAAILLLPLPTSAAGPFDGKYIGTTTLQDMNFPTTADVNGSVVKGFGELNTVSSGVTLHVDMTIEGKVMVNGTVTGTVKGSMKNGLGMVYAYSNQFTGTIAGDEFKSNPTIALNMISCPSGWICGNPSYVININLKRAGTPPPPPTPGSTGKPPGQLIDKLPPSQDKAAVVMVLAVDPFIYRLTRQIRLLLRGNG